MKRDRLVAVCLATLALLTASGAAHAEDLFVTPAGALPGQLWLSEGGTAPRIIHRREPRANPAFPNAIMKLAHVAVAADGKIYFCSGLDGSVMHLLDGRHEIQSFEFPGQVRDVACTAEDHTVYFSVVPTPQNGEPLADGKIYRRDLWDGAPSEVATIRQGDVGGNWWGTFTIRGNVIYLATFDDHARIFRLAGGIPQRVFEGNTSRIQGLTAGPDGDFWFISGGTRVYRTNDFVTVVPAFQGDVGLTDVSIRAVRELGRPQNK